MRNDSDALDDATSGGAGSKPGPRLVAAGGSAEGLIAANIGKRFKKRPVLRDVSVSVKRGEAVGLLGPNGAGKTTCFYIITGLISADSGTVSLDGNDITDLPMYRRARLGIGYLPQEASIFRGLTVEQNLKAVLEGATEQAAGAKDGPAAARRVCRAPVVDGGRAPARVSRL